MSKPTDQELLGVQTADDAEIYRSEYGPGRWVSVHERLPEADKSVLWYYEKGLYEKGLMVVGRIAEDVGFTRPSIYGSTVWPTHWMELPESPK